MGLIDRLFGNTRTSEEEPSETIPQYDWNDVNARSEAIHQYYEGVPESQAQQIAEILCRKLTEGNYSMRGIADEVTEHTGLDEDRVFTIIGTESTAMSNLRRVQSYSSRADSQEYVYQWMGPDDHRTTEICAGIKRDIESQGGAVPLTMLQSLIEGHASQHESGTPERASEFLPHRECRHVLTRHVDF